MRSFPRPLRAKVKKMAKKRQEEDSIAERNSHSMGLRGSHTGWDVETAGGRTKGELERGDRGNCVQNHRVLEGQK